MFILATDSVLGLDPGLPDFFLTSTDQADAFLRELDRRGQYQGGATRRWVQSGYTARTHHSLAQLLRWQQIEEVAAIDPWPTLRVSWRVSHGVSDQRTYRAGLDRAGQDAVVEQLFDYLAEREVRCRVEAGWAAHPFVEWEECTWPEDQNREGGYREGILRSELLAYREPPSAWEYMLTFVTLRRFGEIPRELALTRDDLYARDAKGGVRRLPRATLRARRLDVHDDRVYLFGRWTPVVLAARDSCPVRDMLDAQLT
ncbi:MAG: hypothetical protein AAGE52_15940 [Myxococcota bacterium]